MVISKILSRNIKTLFLLLSFLVLVSCQEEQRTQKPVKNNATTQYQYTGKLLSNKERIKQIETPLLKMYKRKVKHSLAQAPAVLLIDNSELNSENEKIAQEIALQNKKFTQYETFA